MPQSAQPAVHEHITCVAAPAIWLSPPSGQVAGGVDGLYVAERRVLSRLVVTVDGREPEPAEARPHGANGARFTASAGALAVERVRVVVPDGGTERIVLRNTGDGPAAA
ncbi:glycogen debranching N-terminal domain-containing protein, partial [Actinomadura miaoliensis]|uniref:glycogen debranching N-terminal domain-containing protein n=1 Tax=Actinomadura miaoliensis TaxID=430685 RepID=UPI0031ECFE0F